jgi:hypothetical protein
MSHDDDVPSWPQDSAPLAQPTLYVAFAFDPVISPPRDHDPRQYKAGTCLGAFINRGIAKRAVMDHGVVAGAYKWDQPYGEDDPTVFLRDGSTYIGYVEEVPLERRVRTRDRRS